MRKGIIIIISVVFVVSMMGTVFGADMKMLNWTANTVLAKYGQDKAIVKAVRAQNKKGMSLGEIREMDAKWKAEKGVADYMTALMSNNCAKRLKEIVAEQPSLMEIFVMDNQGANVCQTEKTGDYWQGDEAKFVKAFDGGTGSVFVDEIEVDEATRSNVSQVSVPVMYKGMAIGAITFGVYVDRL